MMKRMLAVTCAGALVLALASCSSGQQPATSGSAGSSSSSSISSSASTSGGDASSAGSSASSSQQEMQTVNLYIGMNGEFQEYPLEVNGEITPEILIESMAQLTGWNLESCLYLEHLATDPACRGGGMGKELMHEAIQAALDRHHKTEMMSEIARLREKYDLHMSVERYISDASDETESIFIRR